MKERPILFQTDMIQAILNTKPGVWPAEPINPLKPFKWQTRRLHGLEFVNSYQGQLSGDSDMGPLGYRGILWSDYYVKNKRDYRLNPRLYHWFLGQNGNELNPIPIKCPYGLAGDQLWCKEAFGLFSISGVDGSVANPEVWTVKYRAGSGLTAIPKPKKKNNWSFNKWTPSIFMPRGISRLDLEVKAIRIEPVQQISDRDVIAEGTCIEWPGPGPEPYKRNLWAVYSHLWDRINRKTYPWRSNPWVWVVEFMRIK